MRNIPSHPVLITSIWIAFFSGQPSPAHAVTNNDAPAPPGFWQTNATSVRELQPHWESLLGMSSPRLTQGLRYNYGQQQLPGNAQLSSNGFKALEFIATDNLQIQLGLPAYLDKYTPSTLDIS